ncbi:MAG: hypothetical protein QM682_04740 [Paracoccus sp. (in: a-proteobacteria)]|uniref:hypothetical protein n=1 Tax=Paracoccus sp. TaxID=267 RepID=UPI0039E5BDEB
MQFKTDLKDGATTTTFAGGGLFAKARLLWAAPYPGGWAVLTDRTPFHPVSLTWPDQPGDRGLMTVADASFPVLDCLTGLLDARTGLLLTGADAQALPRGTPETRAVVLHLVQGDPSAHLGQTVGLQVDAHRRAALSLQHTGVHLAALALNQCAGGFWTKDYADRDALGAPNLDKAAVGRSLIGEDGSTDIYRIGKSLRKKGFDRDAFLADLPARTAEINDCLRRMLAAPAPVSVTPQEGPLDERRLWSTHLLGQDAAIPCGGTHVPHLDRIAAIEVALTPEEEGFAMVTISRAR